jgi:GMP synthase-like glutamine amidotransferase
MAYMKIHCLQHVSFETPAYIEQIIEKRGFELATTYLYKDDLLPEPDQEFIELLLVMGGPMGVHDESTYSWLKTEKMFIEKCLSKGIKVAGICLGAQLVAQVLGAEVNKNRFQEIGFYPAQIKLDAHSTLLAGIPETIIPLHWHGDTFSIPSGANHFASSEACRNQGFIYKNQCLALQFHLESTDASLSAMIEHCSGDLVYGNYIQTAQQLCSMQLLHGNENCTLMERMLLNFIYM